MYKPPWDVYGRGNILTLERELQPEWDTHRREPFLTRLPFFSAKRERGVEDVSEYLVAIILFISTVP